MDSVKKGIDRHPSKFEVGDYIGDTNDVCWKVEKVTDKTYTIASAPRERSKTISKEQNYTHKVPIWEEENYAENYYILRPRLHPDVTGFPINSKWKCTKESGLNDPEKDTVTIVDYAYSEGVFWVHNSDHPWCTFIARKEDLLPIEKAKEPESAGEEPEIGEIEEE